MGASSKITEKRCSHCKYMQQFDGCCKCAHPEQKEPFKNYTYWSFCCGLFDKGEQLNENEMRLLGYARKTRVKKEPNGERYTFYYYEKI